jgi:tetratricopeptide (TPR) repeat protein
MAMVLLIVCAAAVQVSAPPLPELVLDAFPQAARASVSRAYAAARERSADPEAVGGLARTLHAWEQWNAAHQAYERAQALAPRELAWKHLDAIVLQRLARHAEAAERLKEAVAISPEYAPARVKLADALLEAGAFDESRRAFESLLRDPATEPMGHFGLGRIAAAAGRHDKAIEHFERAIRLFPEWGSAHYAAALSYRAVGRREDAQRALARHAEYGPQWPALEDPVLAAVSSLRGDARAVLQRGITLAQRGDVPGAIEAHEAALAQDPSLPQAHANLISLYGRQGNWARAEEHYQAAIRGGGDVGEAHYDYGVLLGLQRRWADAAAAYRKAIAANPLHARAHNNLGESLEQQRQLEAALEAYRRAVDAQPLFRLARLNVGRMLLAQGRTVEAIAELEKIQEPHDTEAPRYMFALAAAYVRAGRRQEGIDLATRARDLALHFGQKDLAAAIERDLAKLK